MPVAGHTRVAKPLTASNASPSFATTMYTADNASIVSTRLNVKRSAGTAQTLPPGSHDSHPPAIADMVGNTDRHPVFFRALTWSDVGWMRARVSSAFLIQGVITCAIACSSSHAHEGAPADCHRRCWRQRVGAGGGGASMPTDSGRRLAREQRTSARRAVTRRGDHDFGRSRTGAGRPRRDRQPDLDGDVMRCVDKAPPNSFEPDLQWSFAGAEGRDNSYVTPLVANLTDDNGDGRIDLRRYPGCGGGAVRQLGQRRAHRRARRCDRRAALHHATERARRRHTGARRYRRRRAARDRDHHARSGLARRQPRRVRARRLAAVDGRRRRAAAT